MGTYATGTANNGGLNDVYELGPDSGPDERVFSGLDEGLVLFRNELTVNFQPGSSLGRTDANGNPIVVQQPHLRKHSMPRRRIQWIIFVRSSRWFHGSSGTGSLFRRLNSMKWGLP